ncbi:MAG: diphthine synthase [Candidatus Heimdallarchaeota archaeon]|nr:MAG: diphthine synthase [Candidatus Heimdallarchaeota archaeon]
MNNTETTIFFIGMGLSGLNSCSLETLKVIREVDEVFLERYTNFLPDDIPSSLQQIKSKLTIVDRKDIEENDHIFLENIVGKKSAILISGDPFIATTHNSLRLAAIQRGFKCRIIHNTSIISAAISVSGLSSYRFGRTVTCPFSHNPSEFPYDVIKYNNQFRAHTLVLLDIDLITGEFLAINEAISILLKLEGKKKEKVFTNTSLVLGLAQIGNEKEFISAGVAEKIRKIDWENIGPPQAMIVCSDFLHFTEEEALQTLWGIDLSNRKRK